MCHSHQANARGEGLSIITHAIDSYRSLDLEAEAAWPRAKRFDTAVKRGRRGDRAEQGKAEQGKAEQGRPCRVCSKATLPVELA